MGKKYRKKWIALLFAFCICLSVIPTTMARADYRYDEAFESEPAQSAYVAKKNYNGKQLDIGNFKNPADFYVYNNSLIFILDSGNNRIVVLNDAFEVYRIIDSITYEGEELDISGAKGIYVSQDDELYIADTKNGRVLITDWQGRVARLITRPTSILFTDNISFLPKNMLIDSSGTLYIISENSTQGAYMLDSSGNFLGFYGRNKVDVTASVLFEAMLRNIVSESMREKMSNFIPVEFSNFDIDEESFIYTVTSYSNTPKTSSMIRKLNSLGENILSNEYGTWGDEPERGSFRTNYVDIAVDAKGFLFALDSYKGRIFMYDNTGYRIAIFGGIGSQLGLFSSATAIDTLGNRVLVLDSAKNNITVFEQTSFGELLVNGLTLYNQGRMEEALPYFTRLVEMDANFTYAYYIMSETYYDMGDYGLAEKYALFSENAQNAFSDAKKMVRNDWLRDHFAAVFAGIVLGAFLLMAVLKVVAVKRKGRYQAALAMGISMRNGFYARMPKWKYPFYILRHPVDGYQEMKNNKKYSFSAANIILAAWALLAILNWGYIDYDFKTKFTDVSIFQVLLTTVLIFALVVLANWCFCTLMDGKGKLQEIWVCAAYALLPYVICGYLRFILSYFMVYDEAVFLTYLMAVAILWSFMLFMSGLSILHDYSASKTIASLALTVFGVLIVVFFAVLISGLVVQIYSFFMTIYSEIRYRML